MVAPDALDASGRRSSQAQILGDPPTLAKAGLRGRQLRFAVAPRCAGRVPGARPPGALQWIGPLPRTNARGRRARVISSQAISVGPQTLGYASRDWLVEQACIPADACQAGAPHCDQALALAEEAFDRLAGHAPRCSCTATATRATCFGRDGGPHFVDLDDACTAPPFRTCGCCSAARPNAAHPTELILDGYEQFMEFDRRERRLIEPLRTLRMVHHSAWIARRWLDPAFPVAFPWFGTSSYWSQQTIQLREQIEPMQS